MHVSFMHAGSCMLVRGAANEAVVRDELSRGDTNTPDFRCTRWYSNATHPL
jgi:hypothetical protein